MFIMRYLANSRQDKTMADRGNGLSKILFEPPLFDHVVLVRMQCSYKSFISGEFVVGDVQGRVYCRWPFYLQPACTFKRKSSCSLLRYAKMEHDTVSQKFRYQQWVASRSGHLLGWYTYSILIEQLGALQELENYTNQQIAKPTILYSDTSRKCLGVALSPQGLQHSLLAGPLFHIRQREESGTDHTALCICAALVDTNEQGSPQEYILIAQCMESSNACDRSSYPFKTSYG